MIDYRDGYFCFYKDGKWIKIEADTKMISTSWHSYPKVWALGHREVKDMFQSTVDIQEKIDGSQISFGMIDGELKIKSKSQELIIDEPEKMFKLAVEYIVSIKDKLHPGWTYRGEYIMKPKHNALCYDRAPKNYIIIFDINTDHEQYLPWQELVTESVRIGLEPIPLLFTGMVDDPTKLTEMINNVSYLGGNNMEGIVVKNYAMFGTDKKVLMGKYVSENFKEVHRKSWKADNPNKMDVVQLIIGSLKTPARWAKAVQHLKERGELEGSPRDIPNLMREMDKDIGEECWDFIVDKLMEWAMPNVRRGVKGGLPEWYKKYLIEEAYGKDQLPPPKGAGL